MPFGAITQPATAGVPSAASVDAVLVLARASGADGDTYLDTSTGARLVFKSAGAGILVPERWTLAGNAEGVVGSLASNATGDAYFTLADAESDVVPDRGWALTEASGGASGKVADAPWIMQSTMTSGTSQGALVFEGAGTNLSYLVVAKIEISSPPSSEAPANNASFFYSINGGGGTQYLPNVNLCNGAGTAGKYSYNNTTTDKGYSNSGTVGTGAHWITYYVSPTAADITYVDRFDSVSRLLAIAGISDMQVVSGFSNDRVIKWFVSATSAAFDSTLKVHECFIFEVT